VTWRTVSFWMENLTGVLIRPFPKTEVSSVIRIETQGLKNKVSKTQRPEMYLTLLFFMVLYLTLNNMKFILKFSVFNGSQYIQKLQPPILFDTLKFSCDLFCTFDLCNLKIITLIIDFKWNIKFS